MFSIPIQYITHDATLAIKAVKRGCQWICFQPTCEEEEARRVVEQCHRQGATCLLIDQIEKVETLKADGVHLTDLSDIATARQQLGEQYLIGGTAMSIDEVEALHRATADYVHIEITADWNDPLSLQPFQAAQEYVYTHDYAMPLCLTGNFKKDHLSWLIAENVPAIAVQEISFFEKKAWWKWS